MKFLEEPALRMINNILEECSNGDCVLTGRLEAYSCKKSAMDKKLAKRFDHKTMVNLMSTMNATFPDYDFCNTHFDQFEKQCLSTARNVINNTLAEMVELHHHSEHFLNQLWHALDIVICPKDCEMYSYVSDKENEDPFNENALWSFNYFFYNKQLKKILYFTCICKSAIYCGTDTISDGTMENMDEEDSDSDMDQIMQWEDGL